MRRRTWPLVVLSVVAVLLLAASVTLALVARSHRQDRDELAAARNNALTAGRQLVVNLDALSATTIDRDIARVLAGATGKFKTQFTDASSDLKQFMVTRKTVSKGTILSAAVVRADTDTATVLVAVNRTVKDSTNAAGVPANERWKLDLEKHGGRWLVSDLQPVA